MTSFEGGPEEVERIPFSFALETSVLPDADAFQTCSESHRTPFVAETKITSSESSGKVLLPLLHFKGYRGNELCSLTRSTRRKRTSKTPQLDEVPSWTTTSLTKMQHVRSLARDAGETLLTADFSAILTYNRHCRRVKTRSSEHLDGEFSRKAVGLKKSPVRRDKMDNLKYSLSFPDINHEMVGSRLLEALKSAASFASSSTETKYETCSQHVSASFASILCCSQRSDVDLSLNRSFQLSCVETITRFEKSKDPAAEYRDPLLIRLRSHIQLLWQEASTLENLEFKDIQSATIRMLELTGSYLNESRSIGHNSCAVAAEILTYSRSILMVCSADQSHQEMPSDEHIYTLDAWLNVATTVVNAVITGSKSSLSIELFITLLLKDFTFSWVCSYAELILLSPEGFSREWNKTTILYAGMNRSTSDTPELCCRILNYFNALVGLVSTWMRTTNSCHEAVGLDVDLLSAGLDVRTLVSRFIFMLEPDNGILHRMLSDMHEEWSVRRTILSLTEEVLSMTTSFPRRHGIIASSVVHTYFLSFLRLYNIKLKCSNDLPNGWTDLITGYLTVLKAMISSKLTSGIFSAESPRSLIENPDSCDTCGQLIAYESETSRGRAAVHHTGVVEDITEHHTVAASFQRLRVSDFITREITLEFEATQRIKRDLSESETDRMGARQVTQENDITHILSPMIDRNAPTSFADAADSLAVDRGRFPSIPMLNLRKEKAVHDTSETSLKDPSLASNSDTLLDAMRSSHFTGDLLEDVVREEDFERCMESKRASQAVCEGFNSGTNALHSKHDLECTCSSHSARNISYVSRQIVHNLHARKHLSSSMEYTARQFPQKTNEHRPWVDALVRDYVEERHYRRLYLYDIVHASTIELFLALLVELNVPTQECLEELSKFKDGGYSILRKIQRYPTQLCLNKQRQNIPFILRTHLNRDENASIIPLLTSAAVNLGIHAERLLRLSCDALFRSERYSQRTLVSRGAYAQVHRCVLPHEIGTFNSVEVAVKLIDAPQNIHEPSNVNAVYSEIALFEAMDREPMVARLFDYGVGGDSFFIVMQHYPTSLKRWRSAQGPLEDEANKNKMHVYFAIYAQCIDAVCTLEKYGVVHYDVKADNFLLEPVPGCSAEEFWNPKDSEPPFRAVITDFGESRMFNPFETAGTLHNRGTEYVKAPEMLTLSNALKKDAKDYNRQKQYKCGRSADIWALGCLLYEIIVGELLLYDADWICFFIRTVTPGNEILPLRSLATLDRLPSVKRFILWVLVRDPTRRPNLEDVKVEFDALRREVMRVSTPTNTNYVRYESKGLWENFSLRPTPLEPSLVSEPSTIDAVSLSVFFPVPTHHSAKNIMKDDEYIDDTVKRWRLFHSKMAPAFTPASKLDTIYFTDIFSLLDMGLIESNVTSTVICAREDKKAPSNVVDLITRFMRRAAAEGIATHLVSLPDVAACGYDANTAFSIEINNASHFLRNMLASHEDHNASATVAVRGDCTRQGRILIACLPHDPTVAFTVAAALHVCANEGGLRRAIISLSKAALLESGLPTIHPTDAVRLSAWEAQSRVEAICKPGGEK